ncbi:MAG: class I SAM-dependent methyltransferase [Paludibacter sp.]|nr:class I SAM-dependent methyltransferase [Paludibacter sp.]
MKTVEESVITAMDGTTTELLQFLPYILQDFWEIGSDPKTIIHLISKHFNQKTTSKKTSTLKVLDLGCGKGTVSVKVAKALGCCCYGVDAVQQFIEYAKKKAEEFDVAGLCNFQTGDIRKIVSQEGFSNNLYDVIILGAIGPVLGDYFETLSKLSPLLKEHGLIIIDDGYIPENSDYTHPQVFHKSRIIEDIQKAGMLLAEEIRVTNENNSSTQLNYQEEFGNLVKRCNELIAKYPDKAHLFQDYIDRQKAEYESFKEDIACCTFAIRKKLPI